MLLEIESRCAFIMNKIPPQGIRTVSLIPEGKTPIPLCEIIFMVNIRPAEIGPGI